MPMSLGRVRCSNRIHAHRGLSAAPPASRAQASIGNQARLKQLRTRARCGPGEACDRDEGRPRDLLGVATCNPTTGVVETTVFKEHCAGDCVQQHENAHARDDAYCCGVYANCMKQAADVGQRNACRDKWLAYNQANTDFSECNAYTVEQQCLKDQIAQNCGAGGKVDKTCCDSLRAELGVVTQRKSDHCGGPDGVRVPLPCGLYFR